MSIQMICAASPRKGTVGKVPDTLAFLSRNDDMALDHQRAKPAILARVIRLPHHGGAAQVQRGDSARPSRRREWRRRNWSCSRSSRSAPFGKFATAPTAPLVGECHNGPPCRMSGTVARSPRTGSSLATAPGNVGDFDAEKIGEGGLQSRSAAHDGCLPDALKFQDELELTPAQGQVTSRRDVRRDKERGRSRAGI